MHGSTKSVWFAVWAIALAMLFAGSAAAQSHGARIHSSSSTRSVRIVPIRPGSTVGTPLNPNFAPIGTVPGLSSNIQALAAADRRNFRRGRRGQVVTPFLWYSPYYSPYLDYDEEPQPPYDYSYGQPHGYPYPQSYGYPGSVPQPTQPTQAAPEPASSELQPPPRDVGQFVLVRLDGQVIFASAFMAANGRVTYVTGEGIRRSFSVSELDKDATREMNEANGMSISLPN